MEVSRMQTRAHRSQSLCSTAVQREHVVTRGPRARGPPGAQSQSPRKSRPGPHAPRSRVWALSSRNPPAPAARVWGCVRAVSRGTRPPRRILCGASRSVFFHTIPAPFVLSQVAFLFKNKGSTACRHSCGTRVRGIWGHVSKKETAAAPITCMAQLQTLRTAKGPQSVPRVTCSQPCQC